MRLLANWRRELSKEEKIEMFDAIAEQTKWTPQQIAEETGISERTVYRYITIKNEEPKELKNAHRDRLSRLPKNELEAIDRMGKAKKVCDTAL